MASGFYEIEGGTQPALPTGQSVRIWKDSTDNQLKVLFPDGRNVKLSDIVSETEILNIKPNTQILVYDADTQSFRKVSGINFSPLAVQNRFATYDEDEFAGTTTAGKLNWNVNTNGTNASGQSGTYGVNGSERAYGVLQLDTGTTSAGRATLNRLINQVQIGYAYYEQVWRLALEALSTGAERFLVTFGFIDNTGAGDHSDGVYFRYSDNLNGGQWQCVARQAGVEAVVNTSVAANTIYNIFKIEINTTGTQADFYINDVLVASLTSNLPTTQGQFTGIGAKIEKSIGTTQRNLSIDYYTQKVLWNIGR
mgnify:CR=1 FL=1